MSVQSAKFLVPPLARPQGGVWSPRLQDWLARTGRSMWRGFEAVGQARANRELERLARLHAHLPEFAQAFLDARGPDRQRG